MLVRVIRALPATRRPVSSRTPLSRCCATRGAGVGDEGPPRGLRQAGVGFIAVAGAAAYHFFYQDLRETPAYASLVRSAAMPALRLLDAEQAHDAAVTAAAHGLAPRDGSTDDPILHTEVMGLQFRSPVGLAAGFDKQAAAMEGLLAAGFGFVEVGTVTPLAQPGNPKPRMWRLTEDRAVINRFGFNSEGAEAMGEKLASYWLAQAARGRCPGDTARGVLAQPVAALAPPRGLLGVNVGKNKTGEAAADYGAGIALLAPFADYIVINVSSPNTPGLRGLQAPSELRALVRAAVAARDAALAGRVYQGAASAPLSAADAAAAAASTRVAVPHATTALQLSEAASAVHRACALRPSAAAAGTSATGAREPVREPRRPPPLLIKIAPDLSDEELADVAAVALEGGVDGLIVSNTTIARPSSLRSPHAAETGGLSGAPLMGPATEALRKVYTLTHGRVPIVGVGGVASADDAYAKIRAGASLVQLYSALVYEGPSLVVDIKVGLAERLRRDGFSSVAEAVGVDARREAGSQSAAPKALR